MGAIGSECSLTPRAEFVEDVQDKGVQISGKDRAQS